MKTTYSDIEITYIEDENRWHFELRGRKRSAESLAKAKEAIDKEPTEKRKQEFPRFEAYKFSYGRGRVEIVTVTSIAEGRLYETTEFWTVDKKGVRSKERATSLFPVNESNSAAVTEINRLEAEKTAISELISKQQEKMKCTEVPTELA